MASPEQVFVVGAGGQAKVVISTLQALETPIAGMLSDFPLALGEHLLGVRLLGTSEILRGIGNSPAVLAIGDNRIRKTLANKFRRTRWGTFVHPKAYVHPSACLGPGTVVFAGAVVQPDTVVGAHCIINTGATVDHDCHLGDYTHIAPGANLAGGVHLAEGVLMGIGSCIIPQRTVGAWSCVGAGAVVVRDVPEMVIAKGVPARYEEIAVSR